MPLERKRPSPRDRATTTRRKGGIAPQAPTEPAPQRADVDNEEARKSAYERELDRLDAATSTQH